MDWHNTISPALRDLVVAEQQPPLDPGKPNREVHARLKALALNNAFASHEVRDAEMAQCCLAGVWLLYNYLDESHRISQDIDTTTGSYWHGIMHRRELDFSNAKYWFHRVGRHPMFEPLQREAARLAAESDDHRVGRIAAWERWEPFEFIDLCEAVQGSGTSAETMCVEIQQMEWRCLFEYCYKQAIALI
jgi:hypothetical protein